MLFKIFNKTFDSNLRVEAAIHMSSSPSPGLFIHNTAEMPSTTHLANWSAARARWRGSHVGHNRRGIGSTFWVTAADIWNETRCNHSKTNRLKWRTQQKRSSASKAPVNFFIIFIILISFVCLLARAVFFLSVVINLWFLLAMGDALRSITRCFSLTLSRFGSEAVNRHAHTVAVSFKLPHNIAL